MALLNILIGSSERISRHSEWVLMTGRIVKHLMRSNNETLNRSPSSISMLDALTGIWGNRGVLGSLLRLNMIETCFEVQLGCSTIRENLVITLRTFREILQILSKREAAYHP